MNALISHSYLTVIESVTESTGSILQQQMSFAEGTLISWPRAVCSSSVRTSGGKVLSENSPSKGDMGQMGHECTSVWLSNPLELS